MSDLTFVIISSVIIIGGLVLLVINASDSFNTWYGDSGFLKQEKTFKMNLFNFFDFMSVYFLFLLLWLIQIFIKNLLLGIDFKILFLILFVIIMIGFLPLFNFYKKYIFYRLNGKLEYTFYPNDKSLQINDLNNSRFSDKDINEIKIYIITGKIDFSFNIISLKNGKEIIISSDLPFCDHISEFFGEDVPTQYIEFSPFNMFKYLRMLKSYI